MPHNVPYGRHVLPLIDDVRDIADKSKLRIVRIDLLGFIHTRHTLPKR